MKNLMTAFLALTTLWLGSCKTEDVDTRSESEQIDAYIAANKITNSEKTSSGLVFIPVKTTTGQAVKQGDNVTINYTGKFLSGSTFDSGQFSFVAGGGQVVKGFDEAVLKMKVGEKATAIFPSSLGYGSRGSGPIAPYTPLLFDMEIVRIN